MVNEVVDAMDHEGIWYEARIVRVDPHSYRIHFLCWSDEWDLDIEKKSFHIAKQNTFIPKWRESLNVGAHVDIRFYVKWYSGTITRRHMNYLWVNINTNTGSHIIKTDIYSDDIAISSTHTYYDNKKCRQYRLDFHTANVFQTRPNGMKPFYLNLYEKKVCIEPFKIDWNS
jgi:hypothetical protein